VNLSARKVLSQCQIPVMIYSLKALVNPIGRFFNFHRRPKTVKCDTRNSRRLSSFRYRLALRCMRSGVAALCCDNSTLCSQAQQAVIRSPAAHVLYVKWQVVQAWAID
jgi:hypothetical protein